MIVVADASPFRYLVLIEAAEILPALYGQVLTSSAVLEELSQTRTPETVRQWAAAHPAWLQLRDPSGSAAGFPTILGAGERTAIALAEELHADVLLIDDRAGRMEAKRRKLPIQGTLALLGLAAKQGLLHLPTAIARLRKRNFRMAEELVQSILDRNRQ